VKIEAKTSHLEHRRKPLEESKKSFQEQFDAATKDFGAVVLDLTTAENDIAGSSRIVDAELARIPGSEKQEQADATRKNTTSAKPKSTDRSSKSMLGKRKAIEAVDDRNSSRVIDYGTANDRRGRGRGPWLITKEMLSFDAAPRLEQKKK